MFDPALDALFRRPGPENNRPRLRSALLRLTFLLIACVLAAFVVRSVARGFIVAWSAVSAVPELKDRYSLENELAKDALQGFGGLALLLGFYFTNRTIKISREGQVTDRFSKAVDHLGSDKIEIRIGGICALARIARDSVVDRVEIAELICAFIQQRTESNSVHPPGRDVRSALRALGSRDWNQTLPRGIVDLSNTHLANMDFRALNFDRASFEGAELRGANFEGASLKSSNFAGASCMGAWFRNADLRDSNLTGSDLTDASLRNSDLSGTSLLGSNLRNASLIGTNMGSSRFVTRDQLAEAFFDSTTRLPALDTVPLSGKDDGVSGSQTNVEV
jgi:uncharacterized protein YjbI with pentapeptide repeats